MNQQKQIAQLQADLIESLISQKSLPGLSGPIQFPDIAHLKESKTLIISTSGLSSSEKPSVNLPDKKTRFLKESEIKKEADKAGDLYYIDFRNTKLSGNDEIRFMLDLKMCPSDPSIEPLRLGSVLVVFHRDSDGNWRVANTPSVVAM